MQAELEITTHQILQTENAYEAVKSSLRLHREEIEGLRRDLAHSNQEVKNLTSKAAANFIDSAGEGAFNSHGRPFQTSSSVRFFDFQFEILFEILYATNMFVSGFPGQYTSTF